MMDEISMLRETFEPSAPSAASEQEARLALQRRMSSTPPRRRRLLLPLAVGSGAMAAAVVAAFAVASGGPVPNRPLVPPASRPAAAAPYLRPVSAAQILQNAAWSAEQEHWTDPTPEQFQYISTLEMRNRPAYEQKHPNGALLPGQASYRKIQKWMRIDGQVQATMKNGKLAVQKEGEGGEFWLAPDWSVLAGLTTPEKISAYVANPGSVSVDVDAMVGEFVLPPAVQAAAFRYLAEQPGMKLNPDAVNIDGQPAIGLGRVEEGYLSRELLFDKQTYSLIGDRLIAVRDHTSRGDDGTVRIHKGDLFRQVVYKKMTIVDRAGEI